MPNWCANDLYIKGPTDKVAECVAFIGERFDFDKLIPYPEKFKKIDKKAAYLHPVRGQCLTFDTAWSPPTAVIKALAAKFPELSLCHEYFEQGAAFCGGVTYPSLEQLNDGDEIREWSGDYNGPRGG